MKRKKNVVLLEWKDEHAPMEVYKSVAELCRQKGMEIGICVGALWNAMGKGDGRYENKRCIIQYKPVQ